MPSNPSENKYSVTLKIGTVEEAKAWFDWIEENNADYDYKLFKVMKDQNTLVCDFWANRHGLYNDYATFTFSDLEIATLFRLRF